MSPQIETLCESVLKTALLGTDRQPLVLPVADTNGDGSHLTALIAVIDTSDSEGAVLGVAAALALYQRAGQLPATGNAAIPEVCPPDEMPACSTRAGHRLALILQGENRTVLPEWLEAAGAAGLRVREEHLPDLLNAGSRQTDLRAAIAPVLGRRGRWLAAQNLAWSYVAGEPANTDEETWQTGNKAARLEVLRRIRGQEPARAREMLMETWSQEPSKDRSDFLDTLSIGLSMEDEPFMEAALDDTRKETRQVAVNLLARLPESRFVQRMIERVQPLLSLKQDPALDNTSTLRLEVVLPEAFDKSMMRDGLIEKNSAYGSKKVGEKAWWLQQMIGLVPPEVWCRQWQTTASEIVKAAKASGWEAPLLQGFSWAAQRHQAVEWMEALLTEDQERKYVAAHQLLRVLPAERLEKLALAAIQENGGKLTIKNDKTGGNKVFSILNACEHHWSVVLSRAVLAAARQEICAPKNTNYYWLQSSIKRYAAYMPPEMVHEFNQGWPTDDENWTYWRSAIDEAISLLQFRYDMLQELKTPVA